MMATVLIDSMYGMTLDKDRCKAIVTRQNRDLEEFGVDGCKKIASHWRFCLFLALSGGSSSSRRRG